MGAFTMSFVVIFVVSGWTILYFANRFVLNLLKWMELVDKRLSYLEWLEKHDEGS